MGKFKALPINNQLEALEYIKKLMIKEKYASKKIIDKTTLRTELEECFDSLDFVHCVIEIEKKLKINIPDGVLGNATTFSHFASAVVKAVKQKYK